MKIKEYLQGKYEVDVPTTMTSVEASAFKIPYPLQPAWLKTFGWKEITEKMAAVAFRKLLSRAERRKLKDKPADPYTTRGLKLLASIPQEPVRWHSPEKPTFAPIPNAEMVKNSRKQKKAKKQKKQHIKVAHVDVSYVMTDAFLESYEWKVVRMQVLKRDGARCACCGSTPADGARMNVDHIKPRRRFPQLALDPTNLQVLCNTCNHGKGNWDMTDWRSNADSGENVIPIRA